MSTKLVYLLILALTQAIPTGIQLGIAEQAIQNLKDALIPVAVKSLTSITLPDQETYVGSGLLKIKVYVTDIKVTDFSLDTTNSDIELQPSDIVRLLIKSLQGKITFNWKLKYPISYSDGQGTVELKDVNGAYNLAFDEANSRPHFSLKESDLTIDTLNVDLSGSIIAPVADFIIYLFNGSFRNLLISEVNSILKDTIIAGINSTFDTMPLEFQVPGTSVAVDYELSSSPLIKATYAQIDFNGKFEDVDHPGKTPNLAPPVALPPFDANSYQLQIYLTDYSLNSALFAVSQTDASITVSNDLIPSSLGISLDTDTMNLIFPGVASVFGSGKDCQFVCQLGQNPYVNSTTTSTSEVDGHLGIDCSLQVVPDNNAVVVELALDTKFSATLSVTEWVVHANISGFQLEGVSHSNLASGVTANDSDIQSLMSTLLSIVVTVVDNSILAGGIPLPKISYADLTNSQLEVKSGYFLIGATPVWNLSSFIEHYEREHHLRNTERLIGFLEA